MYLISKHYDNELTYAGDTSVRHAMSQFKENGST